MKSRLSRFAKLFLFAAIGICLTALLLEMISYAGLAVVLKDSDVWSILHHQQVAVGEIVPEHPLMPPGEWAVEGERVHPYFGYVLRRKTEQDIYGFGNAVSPVQKKSKDKIILAVTGGSVANAMFHEAVQDLVDKLKRSEEFRGKEIVPICLTLGGYKQPQQLMVINYFLSIGAEFDIVVNLDGFNEVTLPLTENRLVKVSAGFPREWRTRIDPLEPWAFEPILMIKWLKETRKQVARHFLAFPFSRSYTAMLIWRLSDRMIYRKIYHYHQMYFHVLPKRELKIIGPYRDFASQDELYDFLTNIWMIASKNIGALARENHFRYFHFLQPNLHLPDTKPWSVREKSFFERNSPYPVHVQKAYPYLQRKGEKLVAQEGEEFYDLTRIFENHPETLYLDDCCHLEPEGSKILAQEIGKLIVEDYRKRSPANLL